MLRRSLLLAFVAFSALGAVSAQAAGKVVAFSANVDLQPGSIYINKKERALYYLLDYDRAIRYPVAVPRTDKDNWSGYARIEGKHWAPAWSPPRSVKQDHPELPDVIAGGSPNNPMGAAALTLDRSEIAIHGTTAKMRKSMGTAASYGCVRMLNEDVTDLFGRVDVGTVVYMSR